MSFWDDPEFKKQEKYWYSLLKSSGFKDVETPGDFLKEWDFNFFRNNFCQVKYETQVEYYKAASELLLTYEFENHTEKEIWRLHSEGISERNIAKKIRVYKKSMVHYIIQKISAFIKRD